jgi:hypothetical protein
MRLLISDDRERMVDPATAEAIRAALYPPELWYGASIDLRAASGEALGAAASSERFVTPEEPGELYLSFETADTLLVLSRPLSREAVLALFLRFLDGDAGWLDELPWKEQVPARPIVRELEDRIRADARAYGGTLPREAAIAWAGYLAGLIEWDVLTASEHAALCSLVPDVDDSPVRHVLLGRDKDG